MSAADLSDSKLPTVIGILIVGAGPAGLGVAQALLACGIEDLLVVDRKGVGASFEAWPQQMQLLTPSFHSNPYQQPDLNAITPDTSPADYLGTQHPCGTQYASYLRGVAEHYHIPVESWTTVLEVQKLLEGWLVTTSRGIVHCQFLIWAGGEFQFPERGRIAGTEGLSHASEVADWTTLDGVEHAVIGGYESGVDAAINLAKQGKTVHLLSRGEPWHTNDPDPSKALSPRTRDRLREVFVQRPGSIRFYKNADIVRVEKLRDDYLLFDAEDTPLQVSTPPILATGFKGSLGLIAGYLEWEAGRPVFSEASDESTVAENLFYCGPLLRHRGSMFCFIYKFRARFGIVARTIAERMGVVWRKPLARHAACGFMIEDLSCCTDCQCAVAAVGEDPPEVRDFKGSVLPAVC
jgi:thioredoxin reductase